MFDSALEHARATACPENARRLFETGVAYHRRSLHVDSDTTCLVLQDRITTVNLCFSTTIDE